MDRDKIILEGTGTFLIVRSPFRIVAKLSSPDGTSLKLTYAHVSFGERDAGEELEKALLELLDPVIDLQRDLRLFGAIKIQSLLMDQNLMTVSGPATIPTKPQNE